MMKTRIFQVPINKAVSFAQLIEENGLEGIITGADEDEDMLELTIDYEPEESSEAILEMIEFLEDENEEGSEEDD